MNISTINILPFLQSGATSSAKQACAHEVYQASKELGLFMIAGYDSIVSQELINEVFQLAKSFFQLSAEDKTKLSGTNFIGYYPIGSENGSAYPQLEDVGNPELGGFKEAFGIGQNTTQFPTSLGLIWKERMEEYYAAMYALANVLCKIYATALKLDENWFADKCSKRDGTIVRLLHYPPLPPSDIRAGVGAHTDYGIFTILAQEDIPGLDIYFDKKWHSVPPAPNTLVINVANMLQRWTNDLFVSPIHRAINLSGKHRYSIPYFFDPDFDTVVKCIEEYQGDVVKYPPVKYGDYLTGLHEKTVTEHQQKQNK